MNAMDKRYIIVTDYIQPDTTGDVSAVIQQLIDANPNRTIFFPDGTYLLRKPILTPAHPEHSVDLQLSNFAVIKARNKSRFPIFQARRNSCHYSITIAEFCATIVWFVRILCYKLCKRA